MNARAIKNPMAKAAPRSSDRITPEQAKDLAQRKTLLRAALAGSAPAVIALVILVSVDPAEVATVAGLGRVGLLAVSALFFTLAYLLWRRRWWAALPAMTLFSGVTLYFAARLGRPLFAYYASNPPLDLEGLTAPLILLSPYLVVLPLAITFTIFMYKGLKLARETGPLPASRHTWIIIAVWGGLLLMDMLLRA